MKHMIKGREGISNRAAIVVLLVLVITIVVLLFAGADVNHSLRYSKVGFNEGEWWRLLTAHFVHLNIQHGLMNLAALIIIVLLVGNLLSLFQWVFAFVLLLLIISLSLYFFSPGVAWYVGLSGVLHGILVLGLITACVAGDKLHMLALALVIAKVVWEQLPYFDVNHLRHVIDGAVVVDAHLYGVVGGLLIALAFLTKTATNKFRFGNL